MYNNRYILLGARISEERLLSALQDARQMARDYEEAHPGVKCKIEVTAGVVGRCKKNITIEIIRPEPQ